ncbi:MAG TPA: fused MFS/spermidine synthase [Acidobacteriaceae bacterium]|nr:fused MFS/spermidine synthase [Acidobacteriaceae bacterium]
MNSVSRPVRILDAGTIFLGALLLFAVEPMSAKKLLPALGGSSAVWITCLVFFQTALLLGYLYAHWLARRPNSRQAAILHIVLLVLAGATLAFLRQPNLTAASAHPLTAIFEALSLSIGLPFLLLASTSPLLQYWLAREQGSAILWRLFALSNAGSLLALILYPTLVEPYFSLTTQRSAWCCGFGIYVILCADIALRSRTSGFAPQAESAPAAPAARSTLRSRLLWFFLPAAAAMQLCAVTSHLTQNIAAIPMLWVLPLVVYLLTFIVAFETPRLYRRWLIARFLLVMLGGLGYMLSKINMGLPVLLAIGFFLAELFFACLFCHAEAYALRPADPSEATLFYLLIAAGGAAGTFFIGIVCPLLFDANYDVALAFFVTAALALVVVAQSGLAERLVWAVATGAMLSIVIMLHIVYQRSTLLEERNFYGALRVTESHDPAQAQTVRKLVNGNIVHGTQWFAPEFRQTPTTYYAHDSGIGLALEYCCQGRPRNIGVVGLGAGTLAAYGEPGDRIHFYEINPAVPVIAQNLFTWLRESKAGITITEGDARLSLTAEDPQRFDVLAIDAFTGDAIPLHLLTTQSMAVYRRHLAPGGILAFHVSNQYLDLPPEVAQLAAASGMTARLFDIPANDARGESRSLWVLLTDNADFFTQPQLAATAQLISPRPGLHAWTDERSSLLPILRWKLSN